METTTVARGGALCLTHRQFTLRRLRADVSSLPEHARAEQLLRSQLRPRGVALHTGELNLAAALVEAWISGAGVPNAITERMEKLNAESLRSYEETLLCAYPEVIKVACVLTTPRQVSAVLDVTTSALTQAALLSQAIAKAIDGTVNDELRAFTIDVVGHAHRAMLLHVRAAQELAGEVPALPAQPCPHRRRPPAARLPPAPRESSSTPRHRRQAGRRSTAIPRHSYLVDPDR